jgi:hypothetical protein
MQTLRREIMIEKIELIDAELDAVCGGLFNFDNVIAQINTATQNATAVGGSSVFGPGGAATAANVLGSQSNTSVIG